MDDSEASSRPPEANALFVVTINGPAACSEIARGLDGVREAFLRAIWRGPREAVPDDLEACLTSLEDAASWATHGHGDGRPFWHWWVGLRDGSVSVQRLTTAPPGNPGVPERLRAAREALAASAAELRDAARQAGAPGWLAPG